MLPRASVWLSPQSLRFLACANIVFHLVALVLAWIGMRPGSPLFALPERRAYLATAPTLWIAGWSVWALCTLLLIAFVVVLSRLLVARGIRAALPVILCVAGGVVDLVCDVLQLGVLPVLAAREPFDEATFLTVERLAGMGGLIVANGLYSFAILLLTLRLRRLPGSSRWVTLVGAGVFGFGMLMVVAGAIDSATLAALSTGPTILLFCAWTLLIAYSTAWAEAGP